MSRMRNEVAHLPGSGGRTRFASGWGERQWTDGPSNPPRDVPAESLRPMRNAEPESLWTRALSAGRVFDKEIGSIYIFMLLSPFLRRPVDSRTARRRVPARQRCLTRFNSPAVCVALELVACLCTHGPPEQRSNGALCRGESRCAALDCLVFHALVMSSFSALTWIIKKKQDPS